ncbi:MAG: hypothetical protein HY241_07240 [Actinobacteria bacterium]|nr:hypothetical protein [Actinomycetota bacterium]
MSDDKVREASQPRRFTLLRTWLIDWTREIRRRRRTEIRMPKHDTYSELRTSQISAPSSDDRFTFQVTVTCLWSGPGEAATVAEAIRLHEPEQRRVLTQDLRRISRTIEPDEFAVVEQQLNESLEEPTRYHDGLLACHTWVEVAPEDTLRKHLQQQWITKSNTDAAHALKKNAVGQLDELTKEWDKFLRNVREGSISPRAVKLAGNTNRVGDVAEQMLKDQEETQAKLREICANAVSAHERLDLYEFVTSYDSALRQLLDYLQLDRAATDGTIRQDAHRAR